jgi:hypothetical protein
MGERHGGRSMRTCWGVLLMAVLGVAPAWGVLGEAEASVSADQQFVRGQIKDEVEVHEGYRVHRIADSGGTVVREYVSAAGKVFGVSWQGPFIPNMQQLLGSYFAHLQEYAHAQTGRHGGPLIMHHSDFIFTNSGHMRWYHGRAYVPSLVPANISPEVVR